MEHLVSIIVPVYNTGEYLAPCIESLTSQTYSNLEIILVDDGSTDGSGAVCDEFARRDERIKVIHQKNSGVSSARNAGLENASGTYLTFVDADDGLVPHGLETALRYLRENDADMVTYGWKRHFMEDGRTEPCAEPFLSTRDISNVLGRVLTDYSACGGGYPWNKLWRVRGAVPRFDPELYYFEDLEWVVRMLLQTESIVVCPECLYDYRIHSASISRDPAKAERRELGYHRSMEKIIRSLAVMPELQSWFFTKYAPEIVNGVIYALKNRYPNLRRHLSARLWETAPAILRADGVASKIKFRCRALLLTQALGLL